MLRDEAASDIWHGMGEVKVRSFELFSTEWGVPQAVGNRKVRPCEHGRLLISWYISQSTEK